ncbi:MAG: putative metal-binding motif-containing protein [Alphaproteobacteria bacterium]|nr:putative metal-binding motif-containing protein [Alphaproteobacteria bacterium]
MRGILLMLAGGCTPTVEDVSVLVDRCGGWQATVEARGDRVALQVNGAPAVIRAVNDGVARFSGQAPPGTALTFEASADGGPVATAAATLPVHVDTPLRFDGLRYTARPADTPMQFIARNTAAECPPELYTWSASLRPGGFERPLGPLPPVLRDEEIRTPPLPAGDYTLEVVVRAFWGEVRHDAVTLTLGGPLDADGDGHLTDRAFGGTDCDDADPARPSADEAPEIDGVDQDCDGRVDEGTAAYDDDRDGYAEREGDCDDADPDTHPLAPEVPGGGDNDCDGNVDE